jgi:glycopeptide antibiotics resistance protein
VIKPIFHEYPRLLGIFNRSSYSKDILFLFEFLSFAGAGLQIYFRKLNVYYIYLFYPVYILFLFILLFVKSTGQQGMVLNPLSDGYFNPFSPGFWQKPIFFQEATLNMLMFIPFGAVYYRIKQHEMIVVSLLTITGIETIQNVFQVGVFSTGDIILNFVGCLIGYRVARLLHNRFEKEETR